jgi:hypothetical protein
MESSKCSHAGVLRARHIAQDDAMALVKPRVAHSTWWFRANSCVCDGESDALFAVCMYKNVTFACIHVVSKSKVYNLFRNNIYSSKTRITRLNISDELE